ncbi:MAG TPA: DNA repair protein RecO [Phycisphaerales bacterium]|nr:DNA repair protein RecO [Phycisphaerales bacterium]
MPTFKDQAICIRHWDWSETSQTVSLFTAEHGLIRGLAKGSKRENAPFSGGIELLTRGEVVLILKAGAREQGTLSTLTAWDLQEPFTPLRRSLPHLHAAMFVVDLVHHALHDLDPHTRLFVALNRSLEHLAAGAPPMRMILAFLWALLEETGYRPELFRDPRSGVPIPAGHVHVFSPRLGGLLAGGGGSPGISGIAPATGSAAITTGRTDGGAALEDHEVWKVRSDTVGVLRVLAGADESLDLDGFVVDTRVPDEAVQRAAALLASYFRFIHRTWPASIRWVLPDHLMR